MLRAARVDGNALQKTVLEAARHVCDRDHTLIRDRTNERSVMFHVGRQLAAAIDKWRDPWQVDLEYNRVHDDKLDRVWKYLPQTPGRDGGKVLPDLIVHDRSESSVDANLLVMEAKHEPTVADRAIDYGKLRRFREIFRYRITVFLEFPPFPMPPRWLWRDALGGDRTVDDIGPQSTPPSMW